MTSVETMLNVVLILIQPPLAVLGAYYALRIGKIIGFFRAWFFISLSLGGIIVSRLVALYALFEGTPTWATTLNNLALLFAILLMLFAFFLLYRNLYTMDRRALGPAR